MISCQGFVKLLIYTKVDCLFFNITSVYVFNWQNGRLKQQWATDKERPVALRFYKNLGFVAKHEGMKLHFAKD
jgi:hypothetical protein